MARRPAFTIIELLVVVAIIAILIGILLPAIGKARDQARVTQSMSNLRQLAISHANYGADHNDNQWTPAPHNLMSYQPGSICASIDAYNAAMGGTGNVGGQGYVMFGACHPGIEIGYGVGHQGKGTYYWASAANIHDMILPIAFESGFGFFGTWSVKSFNQYVNGRFYDPLFYAPKDYWLIDILGFCYDNPAEFCGNTSTGSVYRPSYRLSPAALYSPDAFSKTQVSSPNELYQMPGLLRSPTFSQARYPDLKTHQIEQRWLQRRRRDCGTSAPPFQTMYEDCWPYFFNLALDSVPAASFYDGHVAMLSVRDALDANQQAIGSGGENASLWHHKMPSFPGGGVGYFHNFAYSDPGEAFPFGKSAENPGTSYHILTRDGILGRDTMSN